MSDKRDTDERPAYLVDRPDVFRVVVAGFQAGNFSTKEDAETAVRLANAAFEAGETSKLREIRKLLGIKS